MECRSKLKVKGKGSLIKRRKPHIPPYRRCASQTGPAFSLGRSSSPISSRTLASRHTAACLPF